MIDIKNSKKDSLIETIDERKTLKTTLTDSKKDSHVVQKKSGMIEIEKERSHIEIMQEEDDIERQENCKVEFIQSSCWLYSVPNLLLIQHLEILYLGRNHVRIVCQTVLRKAQSVHSRRASQLDLATSSHLASRQRWHTCEACRGTKGHTSWSTTGQNFQSS